MSFSASPHLRGIVIAGVLAAVAVALGFVTLAMNQSSSAAAPHKILSLKARHLASAATAKSKTTKTPAAKPVKRKPLDAHLVAALKAGLPRSIAKGLAANRVTVVALTSSQDTVAGLATAETQAGAKLGGASFVRISVDRDGGDASALTALLGQLPVAPATLVYIRPATLFVQLPGFNDKTTVQQAARNALAAPAGSTTTVAPAPTPVPAPVTTTPTVTAAA
jgi:hypothetical protein